MSKLDQLRELGKRRYEEQEHRSAQRNPDNFSQLTRENKELQLRVKQLEEDISDLNAQLQEVSDFRRAKQTRKESHRVYMREYMRRKRSRSE